MNSYKQKHLKIVDVNFNVVGLFKLNLIRILIQVLQGRVGK